MASSSTGNGGKDLRYQYRRCDCGNRALLKIVDSEKASRGLLYFVCENNQCGFFAWCYPIHTERERMQHSSRSYGTTRQTVNRESSMNSPTFETQKMEDGHYSAQMQVLEANLNSLKMFMIISIVIAIVSLLIAVMK